jgi:hypothetical protein
MANNRMYLINTRTNDKILLAKYYPTTGWYFYHSQEEMDGWFDKNRRPEPDYTFGDQQFQIRI